MTLYIGPDQVVPLGSVLGTVLGFLLIFWNKVVALICRMMGRTPLKREPKQFPTRPEPPMQAGRPPDD